MAKDLSIELLEKSLLGTMLNENYLIRDTNLKPAMFQSQIHQSIFQAMQQLAHKAQPVDYITILTMVEPKEVGGAPYVSSLKTYADSDKFEAYYGMVVDAWREREKQQILVQAQTNNWSIEQVQKTLDDIQTMTTTVNTDIMDDLVKMSERPYKPLKEMKAIPTKLKELDHLLVGFKKGELTIVAGRPSMGKTDVMNYFAITAGQAGYLPIIFSLEMNKTMLIDRLIAASGKISRLKMRDPYQYFTEKQKDNWIATLTEVSKANIHIDDRAGLTVSQMRAQTRKISHSIPGSRPIIFIDYLQIIHSNDIGGGTQATIIGKISWELKQMAKEFDCPVVCLAQLNRSVESRQNKRPLMSDLRDSGNIEQDADVIILLYRDSYYAERSDLILHNEVEQEMTEQETVDEKGIERLEFIVAKNRNGPTGIVAANYRKTTGQISDRK
nr:DnaB-like helicase C-terminal domain-containing protein [Lysinibacillus timonensis]